MTAQRDDTNDYHHIALPKGPSTMRATALDEDGNETAYVDTNRKPPSDEDDKTRWARLKIGGFLGMKPADFEWLLAQARKALF